MKIEEILKRTDKETYDKLMKLRTNYKECMKRKCKDCKNKDICKDKEK